ncbi:hypothetical protein CspeluHIS016_0204370 [Cutaneotrichosporon spelunceum]|uniref:Granulins domain-containing protein n=1 Tax=Cutaneotrichosporon spelunceum TaxID=1672016 RepID=A0AAD3TRV7_9TREE|nr:hypothetical protein CspeluHIS016_0204370 [Cutaneotrichosporon spelunceum]
MKFALALLALTVVAASPVNKSELKRRSNGLVISGGVAHFPQAQPGDCNPAGGSCCSSGKASCDQGWSCWQAEGSDLCCPPGLECTSDRMAPAPVGNGDVDVSNNLCIGFHWQERTTTYVASTDKRAPNTVSLSAVLQNLLLHSHTALLLITLILVAISSKATPTYTKSSTT